MDTQTYFHTKLEREADKKEEREPLVVNCTGAVLEGQLLAGNQHLTP